MDGAQPAGRGGGSGRMAQMEAIVAEHETALLRYATRIVNNPFTAQDVVQNVFVKLFAAWKEGTRPTDRLKGWLYRVTHNEAVDQLRKETRQRALHEKNAEETKSECPDGVHCRDAREEQRARVLEQLGKLEARERQVVLLRMEEGLSYEEIAEVTGRSVGNVGNILHHAVRKLATRLKKEQEKKRENIR